jgi:hypothetical protein
MNKYNNISGELTQNTNNEHGGLHHKTEITDKQFWLQIGARRVTEGCGKSPVNEVYGKKREIQQCNQILSNLWYANWRG